MEEQHIRITEAIAQHNAYLEEGQEVLTQYGLAQKIYPNTERSFCENKMHRMIHGKTKPTAEEVRLICKFTGVDANFLFNIHQNR